MRFGMCEKLGPRVFGHDHGQPFLGREFSSEPDYSDEIAREIDDEIRRIVEGAHQQAKDILTEHREALDTISEILLKRETIEKDEFEALLAGKSEEEVFGADEPPAGGPPSPRAPGLRRPSAPARAPPAAAPRPRRRRRRGPRPRPAREARARLSARPRVSDDRPLDVVVFGASGFAGRLIAATSPTHAPAEARIGLGGRSEERLAAAREELGPRAADWPLVVADSADAASLAAMAAARAWWRRRSAPTGAYGLPLVDACIEAGTDYADLTGEVLFVHECMERHDRAAERGVRIVNACGFDSIPSDLGVLLLHEAVRADGAGELGDTTLVVKAIKGGLSGGTLATLKGQVDDMKASGAGARSWATPTALSPDRAAIPTAAARSATCAAWHVTTSSASGSPRSSWRPSTRASCGARTRCRTGPTGAASATARSPGSARPARAGEGAGMAGGIVALAGGSPSSRRGCCSTACCPIPARARARRRARPACSDGDPHHDVDGRALRRAASPPRATPATRRRR